MQANFLTSASDTIAEIKETHSQERFDGSGQDEERMNLNPMILRRGWATAARCPIATIVSR